MENSLDKLLREISEDVLQKKQNELGLLVFQGKISMSKAKEQYCDFVEHCSSSLGELLPP